MLDFQIFWPEHQCSKRHNLSKCASGASKLVSYAFNIQAGFAITSAMLIDSYPNTFLTFNAGFAPSFLIPIPKLSLLLMQGLLLALSGI
jgi:hypothetical protein